jgi:hypothetical protein
MNRLHVTWRMMFCSVGRVAAYIQWVQEGFRCGYKAVET